MDIDSNNSLSSSSQPERFDRSPGEKTRAMMRATLQLGVFDQDGSFQNGHNRVLFAKEMVGSMLEVFTDLPAAHIRYLAGPTVFDPRTAALGNPAPDWMATACYVARLDQIFQEYDQGEIGIFATAPDVWLHLNSAMGEVVRSDQLSKMMIWAANESLKIKSTLIAEDAEKLEESRLKLEADVVTGFVVWEDIKEDYLRLAADIRASVVKHAAEAGIAKNRPNRKLWEKMRHPQVRVLDPLNPSVADRLRRLSLQDIERMIDRARRHV